jgi:hypothetical protein
MDDKPRRGQQVKIMAGRYAGKVGQIDSHVAIFHHCHVEAPVAEIDGHVTQRVYVKDTEVELG